MTLLQNTFAVEYYSRLVRLVLRLGSLNTNISKNIACSRRRRGQQTNEKMQFSTLFPWLTLYFLQHLDPNFDSRGESSYFLHSVVKNKIHDCCVTTRFRFRWVNSSRAGYTIPVMYSTICTQVFYLLQ